VPKEQNKWSKGSRSSGDTKENAKVDATLMFVNNNTQDARCTSIYFVVASTENNGV
jgi:hypothetical protein